MTTYYVSPIGSDANSGLTPALAWLTLAHAAATATTGGDIVNVMSGFVPTGGTINFNATYTGVSASAPITFQGADGAGVPLTTGTIPIEGTSMSTGVPIITLTTNNLWLKFSRLQCMSGLSDNITIPGNVNLIFQDCQSDNSLGSGILTSSVNSFIYLLNSELDNNAHYGFAGSSNGRGNLVAYNTLAHDNTWHGIRAGGDFSGSVSISHCQCYGNHIHGIELLSQYAKIYNNTCFNNTSDGINAASLSLGTILLNNTMVNNGAFGLNTNSANIIYRDYNHYQGNTTAAISGSAALGANSITGAPAFTNTTAGSEDFTPLDTSVLRRAGVNNIDIGAIAANVPSGGGGGRRKHALVLGA